MNLKKITLTGLVCLICLLSKSQQTSYPWEGDELSIRNGNTILVTFFRVKMFNTLFWGVKESYILYKPGVGWSRSATPKGVRLTIFPVRSTGAQDSLEKILLNYMERLHTPQWSLEQIFEANKISYLKKDLLWIRKLYLESEK